MFLIKKDNLKIIGKICQNYRQLHTNKTQQDVAKDLNMSFQSISSFEKGRNNSATILLWYFYHGMTKTFIDSCIETYLGDIRW